MSDGFVSVGRITAYAENSAPQDITALVQADAPSAVPRMLTRFSNGPNGEPVFAAVASTCTHRGCPVLTGDDVWGSTEQPIYDAASHVITCPCHGSQFDAGTGAVVKGPAKSPLIAFATEIRNDEIFVAISSAGSNTALESVRGMVSEEVQRSLGSMRFPGTGNKYLVDFGAFIVELFFENESTLTYTGIRRDGSRGASETVTIQTAYLRDELFMVTWQEADRTTVVHVEDYDQFIIYTNITEPNLTFSRFRGTFKQVR